MNRDCDPNMPAALLFSWVAAAAGGLLAVVVTALGQAVGGIAGGCRWIGLTLPVHEQPWALVNQPSLAFSSQPQAVGYWFGGLFLCFCIALLTVGCGPRPKTLSWEIAAVQAAWGAAVVGLAWVPLLDLRDGHLSGFLRLNGAPDVLVWIAPVVAGWVALLPTTRLLALARTTQAAMTRWRRLSAVFLHQVLPAAVWVAVGLVLIAIRSDASTTRIEVTQALIERLWPPAVAAAIPLIAALCLAWTSIPRPAVTRLEGLRLANVLPLLAGFAVLAFVVVAFGRPFADGRCSGLIWGAPDSRNNIRSWVEAIDVSSVPPRDRAGSRTGD